MNQFTPTVVQGICTEIQIQHEKHKLCKDHKMHSVAAGGVGRSPEKSGSQREQRVRVHLVFDLQAEITSAITKNL